MPFEIDDTSLRSAILQKVSSKMTLQTAWNTLMLCQTLVSPLTDIQRVFFSSLTEPHMVTSACPWQGLVHPRIVTRVAKPLAVGVELGNQPRFPGEFFHSLFSCCATDRRPPPLNFAAHEGFYAKKKKKTTEAVTFSPRHRNATYVGPPTAVIVQ
jgi:hypothetical protein